MGLLMWMCGGHPILLDPIKPKVVGVVCPNNSLVIFPSTSPSTRNVSDQQSYL